MMRMTFLCSMPNDGQFISVPQSDTSLAASVRPLSASRECTPSLPCHLDSPERATMRLACIRLLVLSGVLLHSVAFSVRVKKSGRKSVLTAMNTTKALLPENTKSNLEMLVSLAHIHNAAKHKQEVDTEIIKERGVLPVTHEEENPLPLTTSTAPTTQSSSLHPTSLKPDLPKGEVPGSSSKQEASGSSTSAPDLLPVKAEVQVPQPNKTMASTQSMASQATNVPPTSMEELLSIKEDQSRPMTNFQNIKDAYFDLLQQFKEFRTVAYRKISKLEQKVEDQDSGNRSGMMDNMAAKMDVMNEKLHEMDLRHNLTRLLDLCVYKILGEEIEDAVSTWQKIEMNVLNPTEQETSKILSEIVSMAYVRNKTNSNPIFPFLRRLQDVDKIPAYEFLLNSMRARDDFNGAEIFHIAQYLKDHNAVRSSLYSRIPKSVQYAISGRNVNIIYFESRTGRNYLHVRDDGNRRDRHTFYIKASQSYTESKAAVWRTVYYPTSESFRIRNILFNDYMFVNEEGFLETTSMANANQLGTEFNLELQNNFVVLISKHYNREPLVATWNGGRFPFYFSLRRDASMKHVANFIIEPDTLL